MFRESAMQIPRVWKVRSTSPGSDLEVSGLKPRSTFAKVYIFAFLLLCSIMGLLTTASATDPLGSVSASVASCASVNGTGGVPGGACYKGIVTCPGVNQIPVAVKVNQPTGTSIGTVIFESGGGGNVWFDTHFKYGATAIQDVMAGGYSAVQFAYEYYPLGSGNSKLFTGFLTGPGGPRTLSCRFATMVQWAHDTIRTANTPFCAAGDSAGAAALGYAIADYGMASELNMLEMASGPSFARIDQGCLCNGVSVQDPCASGTISMCYTTEAGVFLDPSYNNKACSSAEQTHHSPMRAQFLHDSLNSPDATYNFPTTNIHLLFGGLDGTVGVAQGMTWAGVITGSSKPTVECVADAGHRVPDVLDGATKMANDLIAFCH
jgi:hypothetical protein